MDYLAHKRAKRVFRELAALHSCGLITESEVRADTPPGYRIEWVYGLKRAILWSFRAKQICDTWERP